MSPYPPLPLKLFLRLLLPKWNTPPGRPGRPSSPDPSSRHTLQPRRPRRQCTRTASPRTSTTSTRSSRLPPLSPAASPPRSLPPPPPRPRPRTSRTRGSAASGGCHGLARGPRGMTRRRLCPRSGSRSSGTGLIRSAPPPQIPLLLPPFRHSPFYTPNLSQFPSSHFSHFHPSPPCPFLLPICCTTPPPPHFTDLVLCSVHPRPPP